jgi:hypothetical protein
VARENEVSDFLAGDGIIAILIFNSVSCYGLPVLIGKYLKTYMKLLF